jgi:peroxiredoxin family protein
MTLDPSKGYPHTDTRYAATAGDKKQQVMQFVYDIDAAMRANYAINMQRIGDNVYPFLFAEATFDGGRYTLVVDRNTRYVKENVTPLYDKMKAVAHIPLGIFSILSAYAEYPDLRQWREQLVAYREQVSRVERHLNDLDLTASESGHVHEILSGCLQFMRQTLEQGTFSLERFSEVCHALGPSIAACQMIAARVQTEVMRAQLLSWKAMLGEEAWGRLYAVCGAIYTLSQESAHALIIKSTMSAEQAETHVFTSPGLNTIDDAKELLARVVGDRVMSETVFDAKAGEVYAQNIYSLSTKRDLLSKPIEQVLKEMGDGARCPHMAR